MADRTTQSQEWESQVTTDQAGFERWVAGSYELVGLSGSLVPARALAIHGADRRVEECRILSGTMRLCREGTYEMEITAEYDGAADVIYNRDRLTELQSQATGLDPNSPRRAAELVEDTRRRLDLIHHAPVQMRTVQWTLTNWVYLRTGPA